MLSRRKAIEKIFTSHSDDALFIISTGYLSRAVYEIYPDKKNIFYMQGSMGIAPAIGLGLCLNTDKEVVVLSGDGALLMHLGITHTIRDLSPNNLSVYVLDNGCHESVGSYICSPLDSSYPGIKEIIEITNDGKCPRVGYDFVENKENFVNSI